MPQSTAMLVMEKYEACPHGRRSLALHIAQENWDTPAQLRVISDLRVRYERLAEELRTAVDSFR